MEFLVHKVHQVVMVLQVQTVMLDQVVLKGLQ